MSTIRTMSIDDYNEAYNLWFDTGGLGLRGLDDNYEGIKFFLEYNPGLSVIFEEDGKIEGTALCGFDGKRAYLYHVALSKKAKGRGIGKKMILKIEEKLMLMGVNGIALVSFCENDIGNKFWNNLEYKTRTDLFYRDKDINPNNKYIKRG